MRSLLLVGGLAAAMAIPAMADAQTRCERDRSNNRVAGTVVGAGIGALLGSAIAGNSSNTAGTIVGGVAGGIAGNQIAKNRGEPCPTGYYEVAPAPAPIAAGPSADTFWRGSPVGVRERIDYMEDRIRRGVRNGDLSAREADQAYRSLAEVRRTEASLRRRDGGRLSPSNREYIQTRLDNVGEQVRWARRVEAYNQRYGNEASTSVDLDARAGYYDSQGYWRSERPSNYPARGYYDSRGYWHAQ